MIYIPPAQLWLGTHHQLASQVLKYLQLQLCNNNGCGSCITCTQIQQKQHHSFKWLEPEKQYTLQSLEPIRSTIAFALNAQEHYFFIIHKAELLTIVCQNSLLKTIEEPPAGYHFLLLASGKDALLPTIQSRCVLKQLAPTDGQSSHPLFTYFSTSMHQDPDKLLKLLTEYKPNDRETVVLINQLLAFWLQQYKDTAQEQSSSRFARAEHMVKLLQQGLKKPPMPGGSKLFWRNIYLQATQAH